MRRFLKNLFRNISTTSKATGSKPFTRHAKLQMEGLEDRTVPTLVSFPAPGTLNISEVAPGHTITIELNNQTEIEILDNGAAVKGYSPVNKETISLVHIELGGADCVQVNDSNGMPFAQDKDTAIWIYGNGPGYGVGEYGANLLCLVGSREVSGSENYLEETPATEGVLSLDNCTFNMDDAVPNVTDTIPITGQYRVQTSDFFLTLQNRTVTGQQTLEGLYDGGELDHTLTFSGKPSVDVQQSAAPGAEVDLAATQPETGEQNFDIEMENASETLNVDATPAGLSSIVGGAYGTGDTANISANRSPLYLSGNFSTVNVMANQSPLYISGNLSTVNVETDQSPVSIYGTLSTGVRIGQQNSKGLYSTKGIDANIQVVGAESVFIDDSANTLKANDVTRTSDEIFGTGLFGNNGVYVGFSDVEYATVYTNQ